MVVLWLGNSLLRQAWEAMACRWRRQVVGGFVRFNGSFMGFSDHATTTAESLQTRSVLLPDGELVRCNGGDQSWVDKFFAPGLAPTQTFGNTTCDGNVALVEFGPAEHAAAGGGGSSLGSGPRRSLRGGGRGGGAGVRVAARHYFVFRPWQYGGWGPNGLVALLRRIGVEPAGVDVIVTNSELPTHRFALELLAAKWGDAAEPYYAPTLPIQPATFKGRGLREGGGGAGGSGGKGRHRNRTAALEERTAKARAYCWALRRTGFGRDAPGDSPGDTRPRCDDCWLEAVGFRGAVLDATPLLELLPAQQRRRLGFFYGAIHGRKGLKDYQHACQPGAGDDAAQALLYMLAHKAVPAAPYYGFVASDHAAMWRAEAPTASLGSDHTCMAACHAECPAVLRHSDCTSICTPRCVAERKPSEVPARRAGPRAWPVNEVLNVT